MPNKVKLNWANGVFTATATPLSGSKAVRAVLEPPGPVIGDMLGPNPPNPANGDPSTFTFGYSDPPSNTDFTATVTFEPPDDQTGDYKTL